MDESLSDKERGDLKESALKTLRALEAGLDKSEELHRYGEQGKTHRSPPILHEQYTDALRDLQRAGADIPDSAIGPAHTIPWRAVKSAPMQDWIDGSALLAEIKRLLAKIDPSP